MCVRISQASQDRRLHCHNSAMVLLDMRDKPALPRERVGAEAARERALGRVLARVSQQAVYAMAVCDSRNRGNAA